MWFVQLRLNVGRITVGRINPTNFTNTAIFLPSDTYPVQSFRHDGNPRRVAQSPVIINKKSVDFALTDLLGLQLWKN